MKTDYLIPWHKASAVHDRPPRITWAHWTLP